VKLAGDEGKVDNIGDCGCLARYSKISVTVGRNF